MNRWASNLYTRAALLVGLRQLWRYNPPAVLATRYLMLIALGSLLLWLPVSSRDGLTALQALFTACSAVTVTGLTVVDTGSELTFFGQSVLLVLIHLGGLGLMTFAALAVMLLSGRFNSGDQPLRRAPLERVSAGDMLAVVRQVAVLAISLELVGTALLALVWVPEMGFWQGLWFSFFHAAAAFNNAGFSLWSDSLMQWVDHPLVTPVISGLFIVGGLGFTVLVDLWRHRRFASLNLHSKLTLSGTAILALGAWILVMLFEWHNSGTLGGLDGARRPLAAWFTAVTPRTAGFNNLDTAALTMPTTLLLMLLMFVGAGSNSTASGIKVSTFMVVLLATRACLRDRPQPSAFHRRVASAAVFRAFSVVVLSLLMLSLANLLLVVLHPQLQPVDLLFEGFSAFGTVGLSRGVTTELSAAGQGIVMMLMFVGRIGPLALAFALARPRRTRLRYVEDEVQVG
ncbi:potassium transporter TrkG [Microbulbifer rhizosphaerae]|uniref:Trk system potassium uptake protein TrkH n=1 Tax=Microbulbifer rhizosphaerae TaxID=1562603 RepID=A0A7W4WG82_9GAMM|nr:trk system potassium uptake protein TrkH [Microbulbifer rhizosphaerae]